MLGAFDNFPDSIQRLDSFGLCLSSQKTQQRILERFRDVNKRIFSFEEVSNPTLHNCRVLFEFGLAENESFNFLDDEETKRATNALKKQPFQVLDFFVAVRYHKEASAGKAPLKFDYYMVRLDFTGTEQMDLKIFHERGPRYVSPDDLSNFLEKQTNGPSKRRILKRIEQE